MIAYSPLQTAIALTTHKARSPKSQHQQTIAPSPPIKPNPLCPHQTAMSH
ncbi:MAG: hypothetical protein ACK5JB_10720 [Pseudanabaena sp.]